MRPESHNDLAYWFPRIEAAGLPVPKTRLVGTNVDLMSLLDGVEPEGFPTVAKYLHEAAEEIGYPCFLRTGYTSGKHDWRDTCHVPDVASLGRHVVALVEASALAGIMGLPVDSWAVRELIPNVPLFTLDYYCGMPFVPEWRFFATPEEVVHTQPYWPVDAIEQGRPSIPNWREVARTFFDSKSPSEVWLTLAPLARRAAEACEGGEWSVDFLWSAVTGSWWLTDMADGDRSFRYDPEAT